MARTPRCHMQAHGRRPVVPSGGGGAAEGAASSFQRVDCNWNTAKVRPAVFSCVRCCFSDVGESFPRPLLIEQCNCLLLECWSLASPRRLIS